MAFLYILLIISISVLLIMQRIKPSVLKKMQLALPATSLILLLGQFLLRLFTYYQVLHGSVAPIDPHDIHFQPRNFSDFFQVDFYKYRHDDALTGLLVLSIYINGLFAFFQLLSSRVSLLKAAALILAMFGSFIIILFELFMWMFSYPGPFMTAS